MIAQYVSCISQMSNETRKMGVLYDINKEFALDVSLSTLFYKSCRSTLSRKHLFCFPFLATPT